MEKRIKVSDGVGFVLEGLDIDNEAIGRGTRYIVTAVQRLPKLPRPGISSTNEERTYRSLLGPHGDDKPTVSAKCLFADLVSDLAILGPPDDQPDVEAYQALVHGVSPLTVVQVDPDPEALERTGHLEINLPGGANLNLIDRLPGWLLREVVQAYNARAH